MDLEYWKSIDDFLRRKLGTDATLHVPLWIEMAMIFVVLLVLSVSMAAADECDANCRMWHDADRQIQMNQMLTEQRMMESQRQMHDFLNTPTNQERMVIREMPGTTYQHPQPRYPYRGGQNRYQW